MKKTFLSILFIFGLFRICFSAPSGTMTLQYSPSPNDLINSSSYKTGENHQITTYNTHTHTDITQLGTVTAGTWQGTAIDELYGGTGFTTYTTGDIIYSSASNTLSKLGIGSASQHLIISDGIPAWSNAIDANSGNIDGVTIGGSVAPTTTNIGTVAAGTWQGTAVGTAYGGTGVALVQRGRASLSDGGTVTYGTSFGDTNYTLIISTEDTSTGVHSIDSKTATGFTFQTNGGSPPYTVNWLAIDDI